MVSLQAILFLCFFYFSNLNVLNLYKQRKIKLINNCNQYEFELSVDTKSVSHIFYFLIQIKSLGLMAQGRQRYPTGVIIGAHVPQWNWKLKWVQKRKLRKDLHLSLHLYQHPFIPTGMCNRYWCSQEPRRLAGPCHHHSTHGLIT